jgi:CheY-like chemotaxis protein/two-component sensor histidine kinase
MQHSQKLESLGVLAGGIAHDFNNLLQGVIGNADLALLDLDEAHGAHESMREIIRIAERAADLCQQMLAYSGRGKFVIKAVDLSELVLEMAHLLEVSIDKRVHLKFELGEGLPAVEVDVMQVRQVVMNLITNASDATEGREGVIRLRTGCVERTAAELDDALLGEHAPPGQFVFFEVEDDGSGMDEETRQRMFEPFFSSKSTGRGLGLAAVSGIVRGHKGALELRTEPGRGTLVRVLFPAVASPPERLDDSLDVRLISQGSGVVLLIDDEEPVRTFGARILERAGYRVITENDGQAGLETFRKNADSIRAVILDMTMPIMNGEETFAAIRELRADVPVILSSGFNESEAMGSFNGRGPTDFIKKPYRGAELAAMLQRVLKR